MIYLDNNATTRMDREVLNAMLPFFTEAYGNPSSTLSPFGQNAENAVAYAKMILLRYFHAGSAEDFIFTSGATEANNMAVKGIVHRNDSKTQHIIVSSIEHASILETCKSLEKQGIYCTYVPVNKEGYVSLSELRKAIQSNTVLISVMYANNEIGTVQPVWEIGRIAREHGIIFHTDATQYIGAYRINLKESPIDMMSFSAHKIYGPKGIGVLYANKKARKKLAPLIHGGEQQSHMRGGTLNVPAIIGFAKAIELLDQNLEHDTEKIKKLRDEMYYKLAEGTKIQLNGGLNDRIPNNLNITFDKITAVELAARLPEMAFSAQSACSTGFGYSKVLQAIGLSEEQMNRTVRFGLSKYTTQDEIAYVVDRICAL